MSKLRYVALFPIVAVCALGQPAREGRSNSLPKQPTALVQSLYRQVVARHPTGIPSGADWDVFAAYLSGRLLRAIDLARGCASDWVRQDQKRMLKKNEVPEKAPFGWAESGLFSGADERTEPDAFVIDRSEPEKDGSIRVYVKLVLNSPPPEEWEVAAVLLNEKGHLVVDDLIYLGGKSDAPDVRLSELLSSGCDGSRWVGFADSKNIK